MFEPVKLKRLSIACGGTGGHFYPGLSIAREFKSYGGESILILSGKNASAQSAQAKSKGIESFTLPPSRAPSGIVGCLLFILDMCRDIVSCLKIFRRFRPDAFLAMGSFNCIAPALAARLLGIPLFVHDGNARVGKANLFLSRFARILFLSFPPANPEKIHGRRLTSGMPLRQELIDGGRLSRDEAICMINKRFSLSLSPDALVVLIFGGSQGALSINSKIPKALFSCVGKGISRQVQVIHLCGFNNLGKVQKVYENFPFPFLVIESSDDMHVFYSAADVVISRAGGSTIAELAYFAKFAVLVPYPFASENHQFDNAERYAKSGAAIIVEDSELGSARFDSLISEILNSELSSLRKKAELGRALALPEASQTIIKSMESNI